MVLRDILKLLVKGTVLNIYFDGRFEVTLKYGTSEIMDNMILNNKDLLDKKIDTIGIRPVEEYNLGKRRNEPAAVMDVYLSLSKVV